MSQAREHFLAGLRKALGRDILPYIMGTELDRGTTTPATIWAPGPDGGLVSQLSGKLRGAAVTVSQAATRDDVPKVVMAYLEAYDLPGELSVEPALASLPWPAQARANIGASSGVDPISVTSCFAAVASTGSLVILPDSDNPMALGFSSDNRIIVVWPDQIVRHIEDVWSRLHRRVEGMPRRVNFIAGPSRAADAEQASGFGALGRRRLHVVIVENRAGRAS